MSIPAYAITLAPDLAPFGVDAVGLAEFTASELTTEDGEAAEGFWEDEYPCRELSNVISRAQGAGALTADPRIRIAIDHSDEYEASWFLILIALTDEQSPLPALTEGRWNELTEWRREELSDADQLAAFLARIVEEANAVIEKCQRQPVVQR